MTIGKSMALCFCGLAMVLGSRSVAVEPAAQDTVSPQHAAHDNTAHDHNAHNSASHHVVLFAGRTVELAVPRDWQVKQVPLPHELRLVTGPGSIPDDPLKLERGMWVAYHRVAPSVSLPPLEIEFRQRLPQAIAGPMQLVGAPKAIRVGGYAGVKQNVEINLPDATEFVSRATFVMIRTPWGRLEALGAAPLDSDEEVRLGLRAALESLRFLPPRPLAPIAAKGIHDAQQILGSWKGLQGALHLSPGGSIRLDNDAVVKLASGGDSRAAHQQSDEAVVVHVDGRFTAEKDLLHVTCDDGSQLNYRWRLHEGELLLVDHTGKASRLRRLFDAPALDCPPQTSQELPQWPR